MPTPTKIAALVVAAGRGSRFGGDTPKQYRMVYGQPVLRHSLAAFAAHPAVTVVRTVIHPSDHPLYEAAAAGLNLPGPVFGGPERQDSVRLGLEALIEDNVDAVLVHDAARPYVSRTLISRVIAALTESDGVVPGLPVADTLKRTEDGVVTATVPRDGLWRVQTPQGFRFGPLLNAHRKATGQKLTDDAAVLEAHGGTVRVVPGDPRNIKITFPEDLPTAADAGPPAVLVPRTGFGFDVHAFSEGDHVTLCGIRIPHGAGLAGHSDADVALHALADALYGAIAAGDIGHHFPPSDARWKAASSDIFVTHARDLVTANGGRIAHVDLTIICEAPKLAPHRTAMTRRVASLLNLPDDGHVSVKATTTEGLGFTGRREGIAAHAVATVLVRETAFPATAAG